MKEIKKRYKVIIAIICALLLLAGGIAYFGKGDPAVIPEETRLEQETETEEIKLVDLRIDKMAAIYSTRTAKETEKEPETPELETGCNIDTEDEDPDPEDFEDDTEICDDLEDSWDDDLETEITEPSGTEAEDLEDEMETDDRYDGDWHSGHDVVTWTTELGVAHIACNTDGDYMAIQDGIVMCDQDHPCEECIYDDIMYCIGCGLHPEEECITYSCRWCGDTYCVPIPETEEPTETEPED